MYQVNTHLIGMNAGKVWDILHQNHSLTQHQIIQGTGLSEHEFYQAVGWLSRENKICKQGEFYHLGETNLTAPIGETAGELVTVLEDLTESVDCLDRLTRLETDEFHQSVGWLAREGHFQNGQEVSAPTVDSETLEGKVCRLQDEIDVLSDELVSRNHIVSELTRQLTETQTKYIQDFDVIEKLNTQLNRSHEHISSVDERNAESDEKTHFLENELQSLHQELNSRNHIISELSRQLTRTQTTIITQSDQLERLHNSIGQTPSKQGGSVSTSLRQRLRRITQLQKSLDATQEPELMSETKLYDQQSPVLDISQCQSVSEDDLREALQELHEDIDHRITQKKPHLRNE